MVLCKILLLVFTSFALSWCANSQKTATVAGFSENTHQWIDLCGLANVLSLPVIWNLSARQLEIGKTGNSVVWTQGIPFVMHLDSTQKMDASPRLAKGTWWTPLQSSLEILGKQTGSALFWDSISHEVRFIEPKKIASIKLTSKANAEQVEILLNSRVAYKTSLRPPLFELSLPGVQLDSALLPKNRSGKRIVQFSANQSIDTLRLRFTLAEGIENAEIIEKDSGLVLVVAIRKTSTSEFDAPSATAIGTILKSIHTIVIDPGHGGKDPGAVGKKSFEKDIVLSVGRKLRDRLRKAGFAAKMTRDDDRFIELQDRPAQASKWNGDLFISLHCNAVDGIEHRKKANGFRIYILREAESEEDKAIARRENQAAALSTNKLKSEITPVEWILLDNQLNQFTKKSEKLAELLVDTYQGGDIRKMGSGAGQAGFMVLVGAFMPAVLIELGFITNTEDETYLDSEKGQDEMAERIAKSIQQYRELRE